MSDQRPLPKFAHLLPKNAKRVFQGKIFDVYQWQQKMFDGSTATFEMLKRPDTVDALAFVDDKVILLRQQQPGSDEYWSLPGGRVDPGEDIYESIKREVKEETGIEFKNWKLVFVQQMAHKIDGFIYTFIATDPGERSEQKLDPGERITVHEIAYPEVLEMVKHDENEIGHTGYLQHKLLHGQASLEDILNDPGIA
jgi:ADP-ribose pyrophosphatase YjhB (NUDIX family)